MVYATELRYDWGIKVDISLHWWAALLGLALAIGLILRKLNTTYALKNLLNKA